MSFNTLAIEINEHISSFLPTDRDVCDFRLVCQATNAAVSACRCGVWRSLFARRYDMPPGKTGVELRMVYQNRARSLYNLTPIFHMGRRYNEIKCMEHLSNLLTESYADTPLGCKPEGLSKNIKELRYFLLRTNFLDKILAQFYDGPKVNPLLHTLQLVFTHWHLNNLLRNHTYGFSYSQYVVYSHPDKSPMFFDNNRFILNIDFFLHTANFFKYHMTSQAEQTLLPLMSRLEESHKPKAWQGPIAHPRGVPMVKKLGSHWTGSYAYLDREEMSHIRQMPYKDHGPFTDHIDCEDGFQTLRLDFSSPASATPWPRAFDSHLDALPSNLLCRKLHSLSKTKPQSIQTANRTHHPLITTTPLITATTTTTGLKTPPSSPTTTTPPNSTTAPHRIHPTSAAHMPPSPPPTLTPKNGINYLHFSGYGNDAERFHCSGILHPLPPQHGIPGWQRISLMKYFDPLSSSSSTSPPLTNERAAFDDDDLDVNNGCWAYEGVVLPGGMIMLGRWWSPMDDGERLCMGPFIFWNVEGKEADGGA